MTAEESKNSATEPGHDVEERAKGRLRDRQPFQNQPEPAGKNVSSDVEEAQKKQDNDLEEGVENPT